MKSNVAKLIRRAENARRAGRPEPIWTKQEQAALQAFYEKRLPGEGTGADGHILTYAGGADDIETAQKYALEMLPRLKARSAECQANYVSLYKPVKANKADSSVYPGVFGTARDRMTDAVKQALGTGRPMLPGEAVMHARRIRDVFSCWVAVVFIDPGEKRVHVCWAPKDDTRDAETALAYQKHIPMGFVVLLDLTNPRDEELSMTSVRMDCYSNVGCKNIMDDAQRRIHEIGQSWMQSHYAA
jgi:hypothetical protein